MATASKSTNKAHPLELGSERHTSLLEDLLYRIDMSEKDLGDARARWRMCDKLYNGYISANLQKSIDQMKEVAHDNDPKTGHSIVDTLSIPFTKSYVDMVSAHLHSVFLRRKPIIQLIPRRGEGEANLIANESLIEYQINVGKAKAPIALWLKHAVKYGFGVLHYHWVRDQNYTGTRLVNVLPFHFLADPSRSVSELQDWEFAGRVIRITWNDILLKSQRTDKLFNLKKAEHLIKDSRGPDTGYQTMQDIQAHTSATNAQHKRFTNIEIVEIYVRLIPSQWGLEDMLDGNENPDDQSIFLFRIANREAIITATKVYTPNLSFPFIPVELDPSQEQTFQDGVPLQIASITEAKNWLVNSRMHSIRSTTNPTMAFDSDRVQAEDLQNMSSQRFIPVRVGTVGGQGVSGAISPIAHVDYTSGNFSDISNLDAQTNRVLGTLPAMSGQPSTNRKTAQEVMSNTSQGTARLGAVVDHISNTAMESLGRVLLTNAQAKMTEPMKVRVAGVSSLGDPMRFVDITPQDIQGQFDFIPVDGGDPTDRNSMLQQKIELLQYAANIPQFVSQYDIARIVGEIFRETGTIRNLDRFRLNPQEQAAQQQMMQGQEGEPPGAVGGGAPPSPPPMP